MASSLAFVFDLSKWSLQRYYIIVNYPNNLKGFLGILRESKGF